MTLHRISTVVAIVLALSPRLASAQIVRGRTLAPHDSAPMSGVLVQLVSASGQALGQSLSDARGSYAIRAPAGGMYRLRALRIGFRPTVGDVFDVAPTGLTDRSIVLTGGAVTLEATRVTATEKCAAGIDTASLGFRAWEQARIALASALLTRQSSTYEMQVIVSVLRRSMLRDSVLDYTERESSSSAMRPFAALPLTRLRDSGYVTRDESGITYAAPDEEVLLSEDFAITHCIRAVPSTGDDVVIAFEPTRDRRLSDVSGKLVLSSTTSELRSLSFEYANVSAEERGAHAGGELTFLRVPAGGWMVQHWVLRLPVFESLETKSYGGMSAASTSRHTDSRLVLTAQQINRGAALLVRQNGVDVWRAPTTTLQGSVVDEEQGRPVPGTDVRIAGASRGAAADKDGRFDLRGVRLGDVLLQVSSPYAAKLGAGARLVHVVAGPGSAPIELKVPAVGPSLLEACSSGGDALGKHDTQSLVRGVVRDAYGGRAGEADVQVVWPHVTKTEVGMLEKRVRSTATGDYVVCGVEAGKVLTLRAIVDGRLVATASTVLDPGAAWAVVDLVPPAP